MVAKSKPNNIILAKLISCIIVMVGAMGIALVFNGIGSYIVQAIVSNNIPIQNFTINLFNYETNVILQLILSLLVLIFYIVLGFSIGFLCKNMVIPTIGLLGYGLLIPILGAYDFRNIISFFANKVFTFTARFEMFQPIPINEWVGVTVMGFTTIGLLAITFIVATYRSSYD